MVLFALGVAETTTSVVPSAPPIPVSFTAAIIASGSRISLNNATHGIRQSLNTDLKFVPAMKVPNISIARGEFIPAIEVTGARIIRHSTAFEGICKNCLSKEERQWN